MSPFSKHTGQTLFASLGICFLLNQQRLGPGLTSEIHRKPVPATDLSVRWLDSSCRWCLKENKLGTITFTPGLVLVPLRGRALVQCIY